MSFPYPVAGVKRNGTALTAVSGTPSSNDEYQYAESTDTLTVKLASAPSSTTNVIIVYYYLFYTSGIETEYHQTPTDSSTQLRYWQPRVSLASNFSASLDGLEAGVVSIPDASVDLFNSDNDFNNYLTDNDSFYNKSIEIWQEINGEFRKAYTGKVTSLPSIGNDVVSISFSDQLSLLNKTAYMGDAFETCHHITAATPKDLFKPIPLHLSRRSWSYTNAFLLYGTATFAEVKEGLEAVCSSFTADLLTTSNRTWTLCRTRGSLKTQTFGTLQAVDNASGFFYFFRFSTYTNLNHGDTISWTTSGTTYYAVIVAVSSLISYGGNPYNVCAVSTGRAGSLTLSSTMNAKKTLGLLYRDTDGQLYYPLQTADYTVSETATAGGNNLIKVAFVNNFEAALTVASPMDPNAISLQYFLDNDASLGHAAVLKLILEKAGCVVNAASFSSADSSYSQTTAFSIPFKDDLEYSPYLAYVQKILESMLGFLKQNDDNELSYNILSAPSSPADIRNADNLMEDNEVSTSIEYRDVITELVPVNKHIRTFGDSAPDGTIRSAKAKYLHETENSYRIEHVLEPDFAGKILRQAEILALRSSRRAVYSYETETGKLDTHIGDAASLESDSLPGGSKDIIVTSTSKSEEKTNVTGTDLLGL